MPNHPHAVEIPENDARRHVVLVAPQIHWNTGNIGRTCLGVGARLHLIKPLGFSMADRQVKRAGLDYWSRVDLKVWDSFDAFIHSTAPPERQMAVFSKTGGRPFWHMPAPRRLFLVFGSETYGLSSRILATYANNTYHIPISRNIRSLNLSTAVGIALYESLRARPPLHGWIHQNKLKSPEK